MSSEVDEVHVKTAVVLVQFVSDAKARQSLLSYMNIY